MPDYVLAIDAGTSGVRCLITDLRGRPTSLCRREWSYRSPDATGPLGKEFDPDAFWHIICQSIKETLNSASIKAGDIAGISATSQREGTVFLDKSGKALYAGPNIDLRALTEGILIDSRAGKEIHAITGHTPSLLFVPAKLKWFEANQPDAYSRIAAVLTISDWIIYRLTGQMVSEACGASELGLADIRDVKWSEKLQELLELPDGIYPSLAPAGSQVGKVTRQAAGETGLLEGTAVALGAPDTHCGLLGMGVKEKGQAGIVLGWSAPVQMITDEPIFDPEARTWTSCYPLPDRWILESNAGEAGNAYRWLGEIMFGEQDSNRKEVYDLMDALALTVPPGAGEVLAFLGPATMDMSRLMLKSGGFFFPVPLSAGNIQRSHLVRAALENLCFAVKANCLQLEAISGTKIKEITAGGGMTRSRCLVQVLPSVLGMPVTVPEIAEVSALGAAMCAAAGSGAYASLSESMKAMAPECKIVQPDELASLEYAGYYQKWTAAARWLEKLSEEVK